MARALMNAARASGVLSECGASLGLLARATGTAPDNCGWACVRELRRTSSSSAEGAAASTGVHSYPSHFLFSMPSLSPLMTEGRIVEWKVNEGSQVNSFDLVCDIQTDSLTEREDELFTLEVESQEDAYLAKILVSAGQTVRVGTPIAVFAQSETDCAAFSGYKPGRQGDTGEADVFYWQAYVKGRTDLDM
mmetsp:Transcript_1946/g.4797  ORF Transcript_1946/g.4797 Transcript_1946/m.4797 type:complete len:191 (+) Transcript_1946:209-781(+)